MAKLYTFPQRLKRARVRQGYTQQELAFMLGCSAQSVCNFERGRTRPGMPYLRRFCEALRIPLKNFVHEWENWEDCK
jgi:transcriptional regulator with XRE-family HTH domain